jgi:hypothetical protein
MPEEITLAKINVDMSPVQQATNIVRQHLQTLTGQLPTLGNQIKNTFTQAEQSIKLGTSSLTSFGGAAKLIGAFMTGPGGIVIAIGAAVAAIAALGIETAKIAMSFVDAADKNQKWMTQIKTLAGSAAEAEKISKTVEAAAATSPFPIEQIKAAALEIKKFGGSVADNLPLVQNFAVATGKDLPEAAAVIARVMQGNTRALRELQRSAGVSTQELQALGINMGNLGRGAVLSADQVSKLKALLESRFLGAAAEDSKRFGAEVQEMKNQWEVFKETVGTAVNKVLADLMKEYLLPIGAWFVTNKDLIKSWAEVFGSVIKGIATLLDWLLIKLNPIVWAMKGVAHLLGFKSPSGTTAGQTPERDVTRAGVGLSEEDTQQEQQAKKIEDLNANLDKKIEEIHAQTTERKIQQELKYVAASEQGSAKQKEHIQKLRDLIQQKHDETMRAFDIELDKERQKGADEEKLAALRLGEQQKLHEESQKYEDQIGSIEAKQKKHAEEMQMKEAIKTADKQLHDAKKAAEEAEKAHIKDLNTLLKDQENQQKKITEAINEQNKELDDQKRKLDAAKAEYQKGPLLSLKDISGGASLFGRSFAPQAQAAPKSIKDIMAAKEKEQADQLSKFPELANIQEQIAGTKGQIEGEKTKEQALQDIDIHIDAAQFKATPELQRAVQDILNKIMKMAGNQANFVPSDSSGNF